MADNSTNDRRSTVEKATAILAELGVAGRSLTLSQLTRRTGLAKTTAHRLLGELLADGLVRRYETRYRLNTGVSWLTAPIDERIYRLRRLRSVLLPHLLDLYEKIHQTVNLAVLHCDEVVYIERIYGHNRVPSRSDATDRAPAHLTAAGKLLLAYQAAPHSHRTEPTRDMTHNPGLRPNLEAELSDIRNEGVAFSFGDLTPEVHCVAAPVRDRTGRPIAAVALAGRAREFDPWRFPRVVRRTAYELSTVARAPARQKAGS